MIRPQPVYLLRVTSQLVQLSISAIALRSVQPFAWLVFTIVQLMCVPTRDRMVYVMLWATTIKRQLHCPRRRFSIAILRRHRFPEAVCVKRSRPFFRSRPTVAIKNGFCLAAVQVAGLSWFGARVDVPAVGSIVSWGHLPESSIWWHAGYWCGSQYFPHITMHRTVWC